MDTHHAQVLAKHFESLHHGGVSYYDFVSFLEMGRSKGKMPAVFSASSSRRGHGVHGATTSPACISADPLQRKRQVLGRITQKILAVVDKPTQIRAAFEVHDPKRTGMLTIEKMSEALACFGLSLDDTEAKTMASELGPARDGGLLDYTRFIGMVFPFVSTPGGASSVASSTRYMASLSTTQILKHLREHVQRALAMGPEQLRRCFYLFRMGGDETLTTAQVRALLTDFALTVSEQQAGALMKYLGGVGGSLPYTKLTSGILPEDYVMKEGINSGLSIGSSLLHRTKDPLSDIDFKDAFVARLHRQLTRIGSQGKPIGLQLREAMRGIESKWDTVTPAELRRALVSVGVVVPDDELERIMKIYRISGATRGCNLTQMVEDVDPAAYDFVFSSGIVSSASMQKIRKEIECGKDETDAAVRNRLRGALRGRQGKDGVVNLVRELHDFDSGRDGNIRRGDFVAAMLHLGLKVHSKANLNTLWRAVVGEAESVPILDFANTLTRQDEYVRKLTKVEKAKHVPFILG